MRLERLTYNQFKVFLTFDDLADRGLTKEDLWRDSEKVQDLFRDMMEEASDELGMELSGSVAVEVFSMPAQGMVVIVTQHSKADEKEEEEEQYEDEYIEMQVTLDETNEIFYVFRTFEDCIQVAKRLAPYDTKESSLYLFENKYYLLLSEMADEHLNTVVALLSEYGYASTATTHRVHEYGKVIMKEHVIAQLNRYFS